MDQRMINKEYSSIVIVNPFRKIIVITLRWFGQGSLPDNRFETNRLRFRDRINPTMMWVKSILNSP